MKLYNNYDYNILITYTTVARNKSRSKLENQII